MQTNNSKAANQISTFHKTGIAASLSASHIFSGLSASDVEVLASICTLRAVQKNEVLFHEGDKAEGFYVIQSGQVSISRLKPDGRTQIIHVFGPGDSFAEAALATAETYPANAMALKSSQVILVRKEPLLELLARSPQLSLRILASMSLHLRVLVQSIQDMKGRQIESRLAGWILKEAEAQGVDEGGVVTMEISKKVLASQLGVTSETFSRTLARMRESGVIIVSKNKIQIVGKARLVEIASSLV